MYCINTTCSLQRSKTKGAKTPEDSGLTLSARDPYSQAPLDIQARKKQLRQRALFSATNERPEKQQQELMSESAPDNFSEQSAMKKMSLAVIAQKTNRARKSNYVKEHPAARNIRDSMPYEHQAPTAKAISRRTSQRRVSNNWTNSILGGVTDGNNFTHLDTRSMEPGDVTYIPNVPHFACSDRCKYICGRDWI
jgi:hypothetical protein